MLQKLYEINLAITVDVHYQIVLDRDTGEIISALQVP